MNIIRKILVLVFFFPLFSYSQIVFKELTIYAYPLLGDVLTPEITKKTIKKDARYVLKTKFKWLPSGRNIITTYNDILKGDSIREGHIDRLIRLYVIIKVENAKDIKLYINKFGEYEIGNNGIIYKLKDETLLDLISFFYKDFSLLYQLQGTGKDN